MGSKSLLIMPLIFLGAAAAPQGDCTARVEDQGRSLPAPQDLTGRPSAPKGLVGQEFAALPMTDVQAGCRSALPSAASPTTLRSDSADVLHSLPAPDFLKPLGDPQRAPFIQ